MFLYAWDKFFRHRLFECAIKMGMKHCVLIIVNSSGPIRPSSVTNGAAGPMDPHPLRCGRGKGKRLGEGPKNKTAAMSKGRKLIY